MIIGIAGAAGSGKDTVAGLVGQYVKTVSIAQADSMKRFARDVFGFTETQLWGPSECRNAPDERFASFAAWSKAAERIVDLGLNWIREVLPGGDVHDARSALAVWFNNMADAHRQPDDTYKALTPRYVLQTLGTEYGRKINANMWNDAALRTAHALLCGGHGYDKSTGLYTMTTPSAEPEFVLISDVRFKNEVVGIRETGGIVINIVSPAEDNSSIEAAGVKGHRSEAELKGVPSHWYRYQLVNDKRHGLLALENKVQGLVKRLVATEVL
jgi:hypothetical protein